MVGQRDAVFDKIMPPGDGEKRVSRDNWFVLKIVTDGIAVPQPVEDRCFEENVFDGE